MLPVLSFDPVPLLTSEAKHPGPMIDSVGVFQRLLDALNQPMVDPKYEAPADDVAAPVIAPESSLIKIEVSAPLTASPAGNAPLETSTPSSEGEGAVPLAPVAPPVRTEGPSWHQSAIESRWAVDLTLPARLVIAPVVSAEKPALAVGQTDCRAVSAPSTAVAPPPVQSGAVTMPPAALVQIVAGSPPEPILGILPRRTDITAAHQTAAAPPPPDAPSGDDTPLATLTTTPANPTEAVEILHAENAIQDAPAPDTPRIAPPRPDGPPVLRHVAQQLADRLPAADALGFDLRLDPEELGRVRLTLTTHEGASLLLVHADRPETLDLLRRHISLLEGELRSQGHEGLSLRFSGGGAQHGNGGAEPGAPPPRAAPPPDLTPPPEPVRPTGPHDRLDLRF